MASNQQEQPSNQGQPSNHHQQMQQQSGPQDEPPFMNSAADDLYYLDLVCRGGNIDALTAAIAAWTAKNPTKVAEVLRQAVHERSVVWTRIWELTSELSNPSSLSANVQTATLWTQPPSLITHPPRPIQDPATGKSVQGFSEDTRNQMPQRNNPYSTIAKLTGSQSSHQPVQGQNLQGQNIQGQNSPSQNLPGKNVQGENAQGQNIQGQPPSTNRQTQIPPSDGAPGIVPLGFDSHQDLRYLQSSQQESSR